MLSRYFENPMVKLDKDGCMGMEGGKVFTVPVIDEYVRVDSTGAGDAFWGGFLYKLAESGKKLCELTPEEVSEFADFGNASASVCVENYGAIPAMPTLEQVLKKQKEERQK